MKLVTLAVVAWAVLAVVVRSFFPAADDAARASARLDAIRAAHGCDGSDGAPEPALPPGHPPLGGDGARGLPPGHPPLPSTPWPPRFTEPVVVTI